MPNEDGQERFARFVFERPFSHEVQYTLEPDEWAALMSIFGAPGAIPATLRVESMKLEIVFDLGED